MFASGVRNNFPQVCFPRVGNWRVARFFMFVRQFNDFCELLSRIFRNARQRNVFLVFWDTFSTVVQNCIVGSVFSPSSRNCFYNGLCFAQLNRRRGVEIWRALAMLWTLTTIGSCSDTFVRVMFLRAKWDMFGMLPLLTSFVLFRYLLFFEGSAVC